MSPTASRLHRVALWLISAALGGCATQQAFQRVELPHGARVGIVNALSPEVSNVHFGFTVFGTYEHRLANDWHLDDRAANLTKTLLEQRGYQTVELTLDREQMQAIRDEDDQTNLNYSGLSKSWTETYSGILEKNHLAALVVLREEIRRTGERGPVYRGFGVFSVMGRVPSTAMLFVSATADVIGGESPHRSISACYGVEPLDASLIHVDNFADIQMADLEPIRPKLETLLDKRIHFELASAGLLGETPTCVVPRFPLPGPGAKTK
jgi:hypothetical protein